MTEQREHLYSLAFPNRPAYGREMIQHVEYVVLDMGFQVCRILKRCGSLLQKTRQV